MPTAVTFPFVTVAIFGFDVDHVTVLLSVVSVGLYITDKSPIFPFSTVIVDLFKLILVSGDVTVT